MRISCIKPSHGRRVDLVMMNLLVEQLVARDGSRRELINGTDYRILPDDTSYLGSSPPLSKGTSNFLYKYPIFKPSLYHVNIFEKMECDDWNRLPSGFESAGTWAYFIR